jgi:hypothetical protein
MIMIMKKGGVVEKRGEEETKSMPYAPVSTRKALHLRRLVAIFTLTGADYN